MSKLSEQQEKFCRNIVEGMSQTDAYEAAGYKGDRKSLKDNASRLIANDSVMSRIAQLRKGAEKRSALTAKALADRLDRLAIASEKAALSEADEFVSKEAADVMRASIMDAAKLLGLVVDRSKVESENVNFNVSDEPMTEEQWETEFADADTVEASAGASTRLN